MAGMWRQSTWFKRYHILTNKPPDLHPDLKVNNWWIETYSYSTYLNIDIHPRPPTWKMGQDTYTCFWNDMITPSWSFWTTHYLHCNISSASSKYPRNPPPCLYISLPLSHRIWISLFSRLSRLERHKPPSFCAHLPGCSLRFRWCLGHSPSQAGCPLIALRLSVAAVTPYSGNFCASSGTLF